MLIVVLVTLVKTSFPKHKHSTSMAEPGFYIRGQDQKRVKLIRKNIN